MLTGLADASDRAVLAEVDRAHALDHRIDLALTQGAIMSATERGHGGLEDLLREDRRRRARGRSRRPPVAAAAGATEKAAEGLTALVRDGNADAVDPAAIDRAIEQATAAHPCSARRSTA